MVVMVLLILDNSKALLIGVMLSEVIALASAETATATSATSVALLVVVVVNGAFVLITLSLLTFNNGRALDNIGWGFSGSLSSSHWLSSFLLNNSSLNFLLVSDMLVFVLLLLVAGFLLSKKGLTLSS